MAVLPKRESRTRKAREGASKKRQIQDDLLLDDDDPTLNHPALDLEDSDVDEEWTTAMSKKKRRRIKKAERKMRKREEKMGGR